VRTVKIVRFFSLKIINQNVVFHGSILSVWSFTKYYVTAKQNEKDGVTAAFPCLTETSVATERFWLGL